MANGIYNIYCIQRIRFPCTFICVLWRVIWLFRPYWLFWEDIENWLRDSQYRKFSHNFYYNVGVKTICQEKYPVNFNYTFLSQISWGNFILEQNLQVFVVHTSGQTGVNCIAQNWEESPGCFLAIQSFDGQFFNMIALLWMALTKHRTDWSYSHWNPSTVESLGPRKVWTSRF